MSYVRPSLALLIMNVQAACCSARGFYVGGGEIGKFACEWSVPGACVEGNGLC